jgi:predicted nucleotide-binding protein
MKHSIFIGSSSEGLAVAEQVKDYFSEKYAPTLWNENVFKLNVSYLKSLMDAANLFDFAILIFTPDDITYSRDRKKSSALTI